MRKAWAATVALLASLSLGWASEPARTALRIEGMTCGGCVAAVKLQLRRTEGVLAYDVSFENGEATVRYDPSKTTPEKIAASVSATGFSASAPASAEPARPPAGDPPDQVTVFRVPLVCPAVKGLGCGGRARPFMAALDARPEIAQAWLNHAGTLLAVVWKAPRPRSRAVSLVQSIFGAKDLTVTPLEGPAVAAALQDFATRKEWYEGQDVNHLSEQEARALADRMAGRVESRTKLSPAQAAALESDLRRACTEVLLGRRAPNARDVLDPASKYLDAAQLEILKRALDEGFQASPAEGQS